MPTLDISRRNRRSPTIMLAVVAFVFAGAGCGGAPTESAPGGAASGEEGVVEVDPWVLGGTNTEIPLSDVAVDEWAGLMERHGFVPRSTPAGDAAWFGHHVSGTSATAWANDDGMLTEINCFAGKASSLKAALRSVDICVASLEAEGFDPAAASDWLAERMPTLVDMEHAASASEVFGPVGLMLSPGRTEAGVYEVSITMRPSGE
ncbi:hypothetical protein [Glycomyces halotolerans]